MKLCCTKNESCWLVTVTYAVALIVMWRELNQSGPVKLYYMLPLASAPSCQITLLMHVVLDLH
jgi:hypothetical protein